jgi:hypothetical protein
LTYVLESHVYCAGDPSFLESVDIYFDKAAAIASTTPDILAQIKVGCVPSFENFMSFGSRLGFTLRCWMASEDELPKTSGVTR